MNEIPAGWRMISFKNSSILEELNFGNDGDIAPEMKKMRNIDEIHTAHLNLITLKNMWFSLKPNAAPQVTAVNLFQVPIMHCSDILGHFPHLVEFHARETPPYG
jgi:hypothetical protein